MDMLQTGNGKQAGYDKTFPPPNMTIDEFITEFSMWAIAASPMLVTTPIMNCSASASASGPDTIKEALEVEAAGGAGCSVSLTKQLSKTVKCVVDETFGCNPDGKTMWTGPVPNSADTSHGCRGVFTCDGVKDVQCNVQTPAGGNATHTCSCSKAPGPKPPNPPTPVNPSKGKCVPALNEVQKLILLNTEVIAINQDSTPQGFPLPGLSHGDLSVWARNLSDGSVAVALYNEGDAAQEIGVPSFTALGWPATQRASVRDLWAHTDNGTAVGKLSNVTVRAHATVVVRLTPAVV
jgi:hypothetical protein